MRINHKPSPLQPPQVGITYDCIRTAILKDWHQPISTTITTSGSNTNIEATAGMSFQHNYQTQFLFSYLTIYAQSRNKHALCSYYHVMNWPRPSKCKTIDMHTKLTTKANPLLPPRHRPFIYDQTLVQSYSSYIVLSWLNNKRVLTIKFGRPSIMPIC